MESAQSLQPSPAARWGDQIAVEVVNGISYRMYTERPRHLSSVLEHADAWGARPHIVQEDRVLSFQDLRQAVRNKQAELLKLGVQPGDRIFVLGWNGPPVFDSYARKWLI